MVVIEYIGNVDHMTPTTSARDRQLLRSHRDHLELVDLFDVRAVIVGQHKQRLVVNFIPHSEREYGDAVVSAPRGLDVRLAHLNVNGTKSSSYL